MAKSSVLIADDHLLVAEGLRMVLEEEFETVGVVGDGQAVIAEATRLQPDVVVLDIGMPLLNGVQAARVLRQSAPASRLVFLTQDSDREQVQTCFREGASAYVLKHSATTELRTAIREVMAGRYYVSARLRQGIPDATLRLQQNPSGLFNASLTPKQRDVLRLVADGKTAKEIAGDLQISPKTVEFHKARLMEVLNLHTVAALTRYALVHGIYQERLDALNRSQRDC